MYSEEIPSYQIRVFILTIASQFRGLLPPYLIPVFRLLRVMRSHGTSQAFWLQSLH